MAWQGSYFADDAGKIDQYCVRDEQYVRGNDLHTRLYPSQAGGQRHPGNVFYGLVCRVALGHTVQYQDKKEGSFAPRSNRREVREPRLLACQLLCAAHASSCGVGRACSSEGAYSGYPHYLRTNSCAASPTRSRQRRTTRSLPLELTATASTSSSTAIRPIRSTCWRFSACDRLVPLSAKLAGLP